MAVVLKRVNGRRRTTTTTTMRVVLEPHELEWVDEGCGARAAAGGMMGPDEEEGERRRGREGEGEGSNSGDRGLLR